jgi:hypothetical protein
VLLVIEVAEPLEFVDDPDPVLDMEELGPAEVVNCVWGST